MNINLDTIAVCIGLLLVGYGLFLLLGWAWLLIFVGAVLAVWGGATK